MLACSAEFPGETPVWGKQDLGPHSELVDASPLRGLAGSMYTGRLRITQQHAQPWLPRASHAACTSYSTHDIA